ncbi:MAG: copper chaperone PCu(A)C [Magnetococcales bacterium]|nr:copper chaperone PCu(A)C [Magnetococcales bacterium]
MKKIQLFSTLAFVAILGLSGCQSTGHKMADSEMSHTQKIMVQKPWARASAGMAKAGAAFMTISNHSMHDDKLIGASANISEHTELHTHLMDNGVMRMRQVEHIDIPKGELVALKPGGLHIMFINLKNSLNKGDKFPVTLEFQKAGKVEIQVEVYAAGAMGGKHSMGSTHKMH